VSLTALDTGFFVRLLQGDGRAVDRWRALVEGEGEGVVSGLSLLELLRPLTPSPPCAGWCGRTGRSGSARPAALGPLPQMNGSHGLALPLVDALILATALEGGRRSFGPRTPT
jgi:hypothetical protein